MVNVKYFSQSGLCRLGQREYTRKETLHKTTEDKNRILKRKSCLLYFYSHKKKGRKHVDNSIFFRFVLMSYCDDTDLTCYCVFRHVFE